MPSIITTDPDISFIGWSPSVNINASVNGVRTYTAQYADTPGGTVQKLYSIRFDLGDLGRYKSAPAITNFTVPEGTSLGALMYADRTPIFVAGKFQKDNIDVAEDFEFVGWSPVCDPYAPVYANKVYRALYSYEPAGISGAISPLVVTDDDPPGREEIQARGYDGYYDGNPHGIRSYESANTSLSGILSFWLDPNALAKSDGAGTWTLGLPPDETNVVDEAFELVFTANGKLPPEAEDPVTRKIIIRPRPLVPEATHAEMWVGDDIPLRASYGLTMSYDGKKQDGTLIGDSFDFTAHSGEFPLDDAQISTTYKQGDPAGDYPIYVKAGTYGNYAIYADANTGEKIDGKWDVFDGWRFAGTLHVKSASNGNSSNVNLTSVDPVVNPTISQNVEPSVDSADLDDVDSDDDSSGDDDRDVQDPDGRAASTGDDSNPMLWATLLVVSLIALVTLFAVYRRRKNG
jgi:hypothetical protein